MILMSTLMVSYHRSVICFRKGGLRWRRSFACNMLAFSPERGRAFRLVPHAKHEQTSKRTWWKKLFSDDGAGSWFGWSAKDVLGDASCSDRGDGEGEMSEDEKFKAWKRRAEAISELREAQEDTRNVEGRAWENWLGGNGSSNINTSSWDREWGAGEEILSEVSDDPQENGLVKSIKDSVGKSDDRFLFKDRVFQYASLSSAKFIALLIIRPWALDFLVHEYVFMPFLDRIELRDEWRLENRKVLANILSDMVYGIALFTLIYLNTSKVALLKFTGYKYKLLNNISATGKAFLIILVTDIFLGYHSESGWQALIDIILEHYGLEVDQAAITIFICFFPVVIDACVKLWLFKFLPKLPPNVTNIFREMKRH